MTNKDFYELMRATFDGCQALAKVKGEDYTKGSEDALANFREGGEAVGIGAQRVCWIFMNKHYQAITNFIKTNGRSQSEPIEGRIDDMINYLVLLKGIIKEDFESESELRKAMGDNFVDEMKENAL